MKKKKFVCEIFLNIYVYKILFLRFFKEFFLKYRFSNDYERRVISIREDNNCPKIVTAIS